MSTRCNIIIEHGSTRLYVYRHWDGYPSCTGADLLEKLQAARGPETAHYGRFTSSRFITALLTDMDEPTVYRKARPHYETTTEVHGDIDYLYRIRFDNDRAPTIGVLDLTFSGGNSERRGKVDASDVSLTTPAGFTAFVNQEIRDANARMQAYYAKQNQPWEPQAEL